MDKTDKAALRAARKNLIADAETAYREATEIAEAAYEKALIAADAAYWEALADAERSDDGQVG